MSYYLKNPYLPELPRWFKNSKNKKYDMYVVKVYDSNIRGMCWINRTFGTLDSVCNSYIHRKDWVGTVYCVYSYPSLKFVELLTYTDSKQRIILTDDTAKSLVGNYKDNGGKNVTDG